MRIEAAIDPARLEAIRAPLLTAGGTLVEVPVVQSLGKLLELTGEAMRPRLFVVQAEGGEELALRADFTLGVAEAHVAGGAHGARYVYDGVIYRAADGADRDEAFRQLGLEVYEGGTPDIVDAEILVLAWASASAGGRTDLRLKLGDFGLFAAFLASLGVEAAQAERLKRALSRPSGLARALAEPPADAEPGRLAGMLSGLPEAEAAAAVAELWTLAGVEPVGGRPASEIAHRLIERSQARQGPRLSAGQAEAIGAFVNIAGQPAEALAEARALAGGNGAFAPALAAWTARLTHLARAGVPEERMRLETGFARDFRYYDGLLFEILSDSLPEDQPVAAGGRYDRLLRELSGDATARAVGCMVRPGRAISEAGR